MDQSFIKADYHPRGPRPLSPTFPLMGRTVGQGAILAQDGQILPGIGAIFGD